MWRYLALSSAIVVAAIAVATSLPRAPRVAPRQRYVTATGTPGPATRDVSFARRHADDVNGNAPWALSALPECFEQIAWARGDASFARAKIPASARTLGAGSVLRNADCVVRVERGWLHVARGADRLVVPDLVRLAKSGDLVYLDRRPLNEEVRVFRLRGASSPRVAGVGTGRSY